MEGRVKWRRRGKQCAGCKEETVGERGRGRYVFYR